MTCVEIELTFDGPAPEVYHTALRNGTLLAPLLFEGMFRVYGIEASYNYNMETRWQSVVLLRSIQAEPV